MHSGNPADVPARLIYEPVEAVFQTENRIFQGIPSIERTKGGRLFVCFYGGEREEKPGNYAVVALSDDDGEHWTEPYLVVSHEDARMRIFDPCLWMDPDGRLWLTWSQTPGFFDGRQGVWASVCEQPDAPEPVFGAPRRIANGVMMCKPTVLSSGAWLFPCAVWGDAVKAEEEHPELAGERLSNAVLSWDHGQTFARAGGADVRNRSFDEHMVVERRDGSLWMLVRRFDGIGEAFSRDGGHIWSGGGHSGIPGPSSRFFIRRLRSGNLLLVNHVDFRGRNNLAAQLSCDDGRTWSRGLLLDARDNVSYPDGVEGADGRIRVVYDRERLKAREILMAEFREEDVLKGTMEFADQRYVLRRVVSKAGGESPVDRLCRQKLMAIVRGLPVECMTRLAAALLDGGIDMMEVTFNQAEPASWPATCQSIREISKHFKGRMMVGAGTVVSVEQLRMAHEAGAAFFVAPNVNVEVIREAKRLGMGAFPGAMTATEAVTAHEAGADAVKLFPLGAMGAAYLKALREPLANIRFLAVGGVNEENAAEFLSCGAVGLGIGGNLVKRDWIEQETYDKITARAAAYRRAVEQG